MGSPLLTMLNPRKRNTAVALGASDPQDWSGDQSAGPDFAGAVSAPDPMAPKRSPLTDLLDPQDGWKAKAGQLATAQESVDNAKAMDEGNAMLGRGRRPTGITGGNQDTEQGILDEAARAKTQDNEQFKHYQDLSQFLSPEESRVRNTEKQDKIDVESAVPNIQGQTARDVATIGAKSKNYAADQTLAGKNAAMAAKATADSTKFPAQIQSQAINAGATADHLDILKGEITDPDLQAFIGPMMGRMSDFMQGKLGLSTGNPETDQKLGKFRQDLVLAASGVARAHNQRGATKELLEQFEKDLNAAKDPNMLLGAINGAQGMMLTYAHPQPFAPGGQAAAPAIQPTAPGQSPLAKTLGVQAPPVRWTQGPNGQLVPVK